MLRTSIPMLTITAGHAHTSFFDTSVYATIPEQIFTEREAHCVHSNVLRVILRLSPHPPRPSRA